MRDYTINKDFPLRQEQNEAIDFAARRYQSIVSLSTGLGKTLTSCTFAVHFMTKHPEYHFVIICPAAANKAFIKEITKKLHEEYEIKTVTQTELNNRARFHIFNYSSVKKYVKDIAAINDKHRIYFILDEAHKLQNPKSDVYRTVQFVLGYSKFRMFLTATPLLNDLEGLFWMVDLLRPGYLGTIWYFKARYMVEEQRKMKVRGVSRMIMQVVDYQNLPELNAIMNNICIIRKLQYNLKFLYVSAPTDDVLFKEYIRCARGLVITDEDGVSKEREWGPRLHDLQQTVDNCNPNTKTVAFSNKERELCRVLIALFKKNESALVYCDYYNTINRIEKVLNKIGHKLGMKRLFKITGKVEKGARFSVEDLLEPGSVVLVTKAGTNSLNLQKANNVIFYDIPFAVDDVIQMVGRIARMDTKFAVQRVWFVESEKTIDTYKRIRMQDHASLIDDVLCHDTNLPTEVLKLDLSALKDLKAKLIWKFKTKK